MNINIILSYKNYVLIKDKVTNFLWLYSYNKPILWYDGKIHITDYCTTETNKKHVSVFKKWLIGRG